MSFPRENSQSTDATNSNDFRRVVVTLKSQKSAKRRIHSEALHVRVHLHDIVFISVSSRSSAKALIGDTRLNIY